MSIHNESENPGRSLHWAALKLRDKGSKEGRAQRAWRAKPAWQGGLSVLTPIFALLTLALLISGCGPGFPIMTAAQETLLLDVTELKDRVAAIEGGTTAGAADVQEELGNINVEVAEAASGLEEIRQEFSFIRGNLEEADFERAQIKEEVQSGADTLKDVSERLDSIEAGFLETGEQLEAMTASMDSASKAAAALDERLAALERKGPETPVAKAESKEQDPEDLYAEGFKAIKDTEYRKASDRFTRFIAAYPEHKLADHAQYWLGEIYYAKGDWEKAILEFDKVLKNYPKGDKVPAATLKQGYSFEKLGLTKEAEVLLGQVVEKFPKSDEAAKAKSRLKELKKD